MFSSSYGSIDHDFCPFQLKQILSELQVPIRISYHVNGKEPPEHTDLDGGQTGYPICILRPVWFTTSRRPNQSGCDYARFL